MVALFSIRDDLLQELLRGHLQKQAENKLVVLTIRFHRYQILQFAPLALQTIHS